MKYRRLGNCTDDVSAIGLGGIAMTSIYGPADEGEAIVTVHAGQNFIDTSDAYAGDMNEEMFAVVLKERRADVFLATKFGNLGGSADGRPDYFVEACDKSLQRLGIDTIDMYFQHRVYAAVPIEDTVGAMSRLVDAGKVR